MFWLCGMAGTGKSTISRTIAASFNAKGCLGASFFFKRGERNRGHASYFFATVARQLVDSIPEMASAVARALDSDSLLCERRLQVQCDKLMAIPLLEALEQRTLPSMVIVIDALDECEGQDDIRTILDLLRELSETTGNTLRIFFTSRPEIPMRLGFRAMGGTLHEDIVLEEAQASTIKHDLRLYLRDRFDVIRKKHKLMYTYESLPNGWPGDDCIEKLVDLATPLFIYAFTVCRYISQDSQRRLESLLRSSGEGTGLSDVNEMYTTILGNVVSEQHLLENDEFMGNFRVVVGTIVVLAYPLSPISLSRILDLPLISIEETLSPLHSVLHVPSLQTSPVRFLHLSFRDYLVDSTVRDDRRFRISETLAHAHLAQQCLQHLNQPGILRNDLCQVVSPGTRRNDVTQDRIEAAISADVMYACRYWTWHTAEAKQDILDGGHIHVFLQQHFLHWLEALI